MGADHHEILRKLVRAEFRVGFNPDASARFRHLRLLKFRHCQWSVFDHFGSTSLRGDGCEFGFFSGFGDGFHRQLCCGQGFPGGDPEDFHGGKLDVQSEKCRVGSEKWGRLR